MPKYKNVKAIKSFSAGAIVCVAGKEPRVLLLTQNNEFYKRPKSTGDVVDIGPKGRIEPGEDAVAAAEREIFEEIGIRPYLDTSFSATKKYTFYEKNAAGQTERIDKSVIYFLAIVDEDKAKQIKISREHKKCEILTFSDAIKRVKHANEKEIITKCCEYLKANMKKIIMK